MGNVLVQESSLQDIADSIRLKNGTQTKYKPAEMSDAIEAISGGGITPTGTISITSNDTSDVTQYASASVNVPQGTTPTGTKSITANGTGIDVASYAYADVAVPNTYAAGDEGKVVSSGALVSQTSDTVTTNDTYDTTLISSLTVNVSGGGGGTHNLPSGYTEYEYIEASGTQYINTGYVPTNASDITYTFQRTASGQSYNGVEFGSQSSPKCIASGRYFGWGSAVDKTGNYDPDQIFGPMTINVKSSGCYNLVAGKAVDFGTPTWTSGTNALYIAARNNAGTAERFAKE